MVATLQRFAVLALVSCTGCYSGLAVDAGDLPGDDDPPTGPRDPSRSDGSDDDDTGPSGEVEEGDALAEIGLRRLSAHEYDQSVAFLLGATVRSAEGLLPVDLPPDDEDFAFETHYEAQIVSNALITAAETLAQEHVEALLADPQRRDAVVGCVPDGTDDQACMRSFVEAFGRRAFRRPLSEDEILRYLELQSCAGSAHDDCGFAIDADDFYEGVAAVLSSMLVSPTFLYRVEIGEPVQDRPGAFRLGPYELASRLSFFLWGVTPDDTLLDAAEDGALDDAQGVRATAEWMLEDPRAHAQFARFHAVWLGYADMRHDDGLAEAMRRESDALVERVLFEERRPWADLFTLGETFVDDQLASLYGLPAPGIEEGAWVELPPESGRAGILGHGSMLSVGSKASYATSPTARGYRLSTMALCQAIPPPPPNVPADTSGAEGECKADKVEAHAQGSCYGCHQFMDGLGLGLEAYDGLGRLRDREIEDPGCEIKAEGTFPPVAGQPATKFSGPAELGTLMTESEQLQACAATQLVRFAVSRTIRRPGVKPGIHEEDVPLVDTLIETLGKEGRFDDLVLELVSSPFFLHRVEY